MFTLCIDKSIIYLDELKGGNIMNAKFLLGAILGVVIGLFVAGVYGSVAVFVIVSLIGIWKKHRNLRI